MILHARPVFVVLNKQILSLFENENVNSLIKSINIKTLSHPAVVVALNKYHCFQLFDTPVSDLDVNQIVPIQNPQNNAVLTLCADSDLKMTEWAQSIIDFDNCKVELIPKFESLSYEEQIELKRK